MDFISISSLFVYIFFVLWLLISNHALPIFRKVKRARITKQPLTDKLRDDISSIPVDSVPNTRVKQAPMFSTEYLKTTGITDSIRENFLTVNDVFKLAEPYTTIAYEGEFDDRWSVKTLQESFRDTEYGRTFQLLPVGESIRAEALFEQLEESSRVEKPIRRVIVGEGEFYFGNPDNDHSGKYYIDWQGRAITYRLAALKMIPDLPITDLDNIDVDFSARTPDNQFSLWQIIDIYVPDIFDPAGEYVLSLRVNQIRFFESDTEGIWHERDPLIHLNIDEVSKSNKERRATNVFLKRQPIPASYFDSAKLIDPEPHEAWQGISAPLPRDLQIPED